MQVYRHAGRETAAKKTRCLTGRDAAVTRCWSDVEVLSLSVLLIISIILVLQLPITVIKEISSKRYNVPLNYSSIIGYKCVQHNLYVLILLVCYVLLLILCLKIVRVAFLCLPLPCCHSATPAMLRVSERSQRCLNVRCRHRALPDTTATATTTLRP